MTSRELFQQRSTLANGDTSWQLSPLVTAAIEGRLAVLDGVHRLDTGTLGVLKRYIIQSAANVCVYVYHHWVCFCTYIVRTCMNCH